MVKIIGYTANLIRAMVKLHRIDGERSCHHHEWDSPINVHVCFDWWAEVYFTSLTSHCLSCAPIYRSSTCSYPRARINDHSFDNFPSPSPDERERRKPLQLKRLPVTQPVCYSSPWAWEKGKGFRQDYDWLNATRSNLGLDRAVRGPQLTWAISWVSSGYKRFKLGKVIL